MIYPSTATLASDGTGTATLTSPSGFGEAFGEAFGGWQPAATAVLYTPPGTGALSGGDVVTATLAGNGVSTATVSEVPALAELQLV